MDVVFCAFLVVGGCCVVSSIGMIRDLRYCIVVGLVDLGLGCGVVLFVWF